MKTSYISLSATRSAAGSTLIEVLIAMLLLAVGVLGAASMQLNALKYNQFAMVRSQAVLAAYSIIDSMRANKAGLRNGNYVISNPDNIDASTIAGADLKALQNSLVNLPQATFQIASVASLGFQQVTVTISWSEARAAKVNSGQTANTGQSGSVTVGALL